MAREVMAGADPTEAARRHGFTVVDEEARPDGVCADCGGDGYELVEQPAEKAWPQAAPCHCASGQVQKQRLVDRAFGFKSQIPAEFFGRTFETYLPIADEAQLEACARVQEWVGQGERSMLLYGDFGRGKTALAIAAARARQESRGSSVLFRTTPALLDAIRETFNRDTGGATTSEVMQAILGVDVLVLDDIGSEMLTPWVRDRLQLFIGHRHDEGLATIFTMNYRTKAEAAELGGPGYDSPLEAVQERISERAAWRVQEMTKGYMIHVGGANMRDT